MIGPSNPAREAQNPDILVPPRADYGTLSNLRASFADSHMHLAPGGWGRQTTARKLPAATELAGVNMRLKPGAVREMHWHKAAEWRSCSQGAPASPPSISTVTRSRTTSARAICGATPVVPA